MKEPEKKNADEVKRLTDKVQYFKSEEYTTKVLDIFKSSKVYQSELFDKAIPFYNYGATHILRQFHQFIPDKRLMCKAFESSFAEKEFRSGADFVPFSEEEMKEIQDVDVQSGEVWIHPPLVRPTHFELCEQFNKTRTTSNAVPTTTTSDGEVRGASSHAPFDPPPPIGGA